MIDIAYVYSLLVGVLLWNLDPFLLDNDLVSFPDNLSRPFYIFPIVILIELIFIFSLPYYAEQFRKSFLIYKKNLLLNYEKTTMSCCHNSILKHQFSLLKKMYS